MLAAIAGACCTIAKRDPVRKAEAVRAARAAADWLIANAEPKDRPLAHFPPTYRGTGNKAAQYAGEVMLVYPGLAALAYLQVYGITGEAKYLAEAEAVASTYLRLQGKDGTWALKMRFSDGATICPNRLVPVSVMMPLFDQLYELTGKEPYRDASARAFANLERTRLATWDWEGQFEDVDPNDPYQDMTFHDAASTVIYFCRKFPKDAGRMAQARELMRYIEDQFVCWEKPYVQMGYPADTSMCDLRTWTTPCALEQYWWYNPIDSAAARVVEAFLALYAVERRPLDLAKAKALGEALTRVQWNDGGIPTHWAGNETRDSIWINCHVASARALDALSQAIEGVAERK